MPARTHFTSILLTALTTAGLAVQAQSDKTSAMTSTAIEWNSLEVKTNATGSSRKFFEGPTATLDDAGVPCLHPQSGRDQPRDP
jgi:hypothetical protein